MVLILIAESQGSLKKLALVNTTVSVHSSRPHGSFMGAIVFQCEWKTARLKSAPLHFEKAQ
jgi:hypothetical protein